MCGIFGHYSFNAPGNLKSSLDALFHGLGRLEYRGYDSAGMCFDVSADRVHSRDDHATHDAGHEEDATAHDTHADSHGGHDAGSDHQQATRPWAALFVNAIFFLGIGIGVLVGVYNILFIQPLLTGYPYFFIKLFFVVIMIFLYK